MTIKHLVSKNFINCKHKINVLKCFLLAFCCCCYCCCHVSFSSSQPTVYVLLHVFTLSVAVQFIIYLCVVVAVNLYNIILVVFGTYLLSALSLALFFFFTKCVCVQKNNNNLHFYPGSGTEQGNEREKKMKTSWFLLL